MRAIFLRSSLITIAASTQKLAPSRLDIRMFSKNFAAVGSKATGCGSSSPSLPDLGTVHAALATADNRPPCGEG